MSNLALRPHGRDAHAPLFCVAELGTSFDGGWRGLAGCSRNFKCRVFRAGSREAAGPEAPALPALPRHFLRRSRVDSCSGTRNEFRRRLVQPRGLRSKFFQNSATGEWWSGADLLRRCRLDSCSGTRNEFRRRLVQPRGMWLKLRRIHSLGGIGITVQTGFPCGLGR
jgi:hypothetical protein